MLRTALPFPLVGYFGSLSYPFRCRCLRSDSFLCTATALHCATPHLLQSSAVAITQPNQYAALLIGFSFNTLTSLLLHVLASHSISVQGSPTAVNNCARLRGDLLRFRLSWYHPCLYLRYA
jgi:hypothetical protein